jgi:uncharacterized protein (DUF983 family)
MKTKSKVYSILNNKCPHCHKGNFFQATNAYNLRSFGVMNKRCSHCNEDFIREPGYYFGASYVSYSLTVGMGIGLYALLEGVFKLETVSFLIIFSSMLIALLPVFYRISRLIWINFFVHYSENAASKRIGENFCRS